MPRVFQTPPSRGNSSNALRAYATARAASRSSGFEEVAQILGIPVGTAKVRAHRAIRELREIYHGLTYDAPAVTALSVSDDIFVINSFSKYFGMTGWRLGWLVAPEDVVPEIDKLAQNLFLAAPTLAQHAALTAFEPQNIAILESRREAFRERRDYLLPALRELGFDIPVTPGGAFYLYADCSRFTDDSFRFSGQLLEEAGVDTVPELAQRNAENLYAKLKETNAQKDLVRQLPGARQVEDWIAQAKALPRVVTY